MSSVGREQDLESFMNDFQTNLEAQKEMSQWDLNFDRRLLNMTGRTYIPEYIFQREDQFTYKQQNADWPKTSLKVSNMDVVRFYPFQSAQTPI